MPSSDPHQAGRAELSDDQIDWVIAAYTAGDVAEEQMSALAMAIVLPRADPARAGRWTGP
jgi:thymidine phosphorylase